MLPDLEIALCGSNSICLPNINQRTFSDINELKSHVGVSSTSCVFIIVLTNLNSQDIDKIEELQRQSHIFAIVVGIKPKSTLNVRGNNIFPVAKQFLSYKIRSNVIRFFEEASKKLLQKNLFILAKMFKDKLDIIKHQRFTTMQVCEIILIILVIFTNEFRSKHAMY